MNKGSEKIMNKRPKKSGYRNKENLADLEKFLKTNNLEIITAALLLSGKLRVNSIQLTRSGALSVILFGEILEELSLLLNKDKKNVENILKEIQDLNF